MPLIVSGAPAAVVDQAVRLFGREPREQLPVAKGYRNESHAVRLADGSCVNLIIYKSEPGMAVTIQNANRVSNFLAGHGFPARRTIDDRILQLHTNRSTKYAAIYNYLPGDTLAWEAYTQKHLKLLGRSLSDMHAMLADFDTRGLPDVADIYLIILECMRHYFAEPGVRAAMTQKLSLAPPKLNGYAALLRACRRSRNQQALHMDFVRSNILFDDSCGELTISGILDFEKTAHGNPLFDIARTLAFLLIDCKYKSADKVCKYFLQSGYQKRGAARLPNVSIQTAAVQINAFDKLIDLFLTYDFYKFLRHNPYESLPQNEHFMRTCDLLRERAQLDSI